MFVSKNRQHTAQRKFLARLELEELPPFLTYLDSEFSFELIHAWIELLASWLMDKNCKLANQAKQLASAEVK